MSREQQERPLTVMEIAGHLIRPLTPATPMSGMFIFFISGGSRISQTDTKECQPIIGLSQKDLYEGKREF